MHLAADESVDNGIVKGLRALGVEVLCIAEDFPGINDDIVLKKIFEKNKIVIDKKRKAKNQNHQDIKSFCFKKIICT